MYRFRFYTSENDHDGSSVLSHWPVGLIIGIGALGACLGVGIMSRQVHRSRRRASRS